MDKIEQLSQITQTPVVELIEEGVYDSICQGICINPGCDYTDEVEPDQDRGYCETCKTHTVQSVLILSGMI